MAGPCLGAANNQIITDINLAPTVTSGGSTVVQYVSSFTLVKPVDNNNISPLGIMWHDVPNRGGRITINVAEQNLGDVGVEQRLAGRQRRVRPLFPPVPRILLAGAGRLSHNEWVKTPVACRRYGANRRPHHQSQRLERSSRST